jgi:hypothetical protein
MQKDCTGRFTTRLLLLQQSQFRTYFQCLNAPGVVPQLHHNLLPALVIRLALPDAQLVVLVAPLLYTPAACRAV